MKLSKFTTASLLAAAFAGTASAQTVIRISGAATYRPPVIKAIESLLVSSGVDQYKFGYQGGNRYRPLYNIYAGKLVSTGDPVIIETAWTGDVSGVVNLATQNAITWVKTDAPTLATLTTSGVSNLSSSLRTESAVPDATVAVTFADSSAAVISTAPTVGATIAGQITSAALADSGTAPLAGGAGTIGLAAFEWVLGRYDTTVAATQPFSNITQSSAATLIAGGPIPVSYLSGNSADAFRYAFAVGRSQDGGARTVPFAEAQLGFLTPSKQFQLKFDITGTTQADGLSTGGAAAKVTGLIPWPANSPLLTIPSVNWNQAGNSGYNLTSDLSNALSALNPVSVTVGSTPVANTVLISSADAATLTGITQAFLVGYNGVADTAALVANGGVALKYNGVAYSQAAVKSGQYSLWSFAHLYQIPSGTGSISGVTKQTVDEVADAIYQTYAVTDGSGVANVATPTTGAAGIIFDSSVLATRTIEGGLLFQTY